MCAGVVKLPFLELTPPMLRLVHSANWQLGARFALLGPKAGQRRAARLTTLQKTLALVSSKQCDGVLIAGDRLGRTYCDLLSLARCSVLQTSEHPFPTYLARR